jgi:anti-sigma B factor antagonist
MSTEQQIVVDRATGGVAVIVMQGEHDVYTAPQLRAAVAELIGDGRPVVVDLTPSTFVDSSILGVLLGGLRNAREHDVGFALVLGESGEPTVRRILEVTGLFPVLPMHDTREEAEHALLDGRA